MLNKDKSILNKSNIKCKEASLTVEAALVMPLFLYFMLAFLYFIQIFTIQEKIQSSITKMGLNLTKTAYFYKDFPEIEEALNFDKTLFGSDFDIGLSDISDKIMSGYTLKLFAKEYLDKDWINNSCIKDGFTGIDFFYSSLNNEEGYIDIVLNYKVSIPIKIFVLGDMNMLQRVKLRAWTGNEIAAVYETNEESDKEETVVYIAETGSVYHKSNTCSHLKLSIRPVNGIPDALRNDSGAKYKKCEECCKGKLDVNATYYITTYGTRYHSNIKCSGLKRTIQEIPLSKAGSRKPCSRCYK